MQCFSIFIYWQLHECIRTSGTFMGQKPAEPKDPPRHCPSNVQTSAVTVIGKFLMEDFCQTPGLKAAMQLAPYGLLWLPFENLLLELCT